jgi:iduronate 2-sulfatase
MKTRTSGRSAAWLVGMLLILLAGPAWGQPGQKRLNVLFIAVDDMNNDLACYGVPLVKSPNIDRLAARGVKFERAYCQYPLCSPSRTSLMTGLRPDTTKVYDLKTHFRKTIPNVITIGQMFKANGYFSGRVGKIYHYGNPGDIGTSGLDDPATWNEVVNPAGRDKTALEIDVINYTPKRKLGAAMAFLSDKEGKDEEHTDGKVATEAIKMLRAHKDKPFFIAAGFYKPHCPYISPSKYFEEYALKDVLLPKVADGFAKSVPPLALASTKPWPILGVSPEKARETKLGYYAAVSFVDAQVGRIVDEVDRLGLWDNTVVIFWSDHGFHLGEHGLWFKQSVFEESARVPMVIVTPGNGAVAGKVCARTVELVDLYPTLADLTGLTPPKGLEGYSLKPLLENPAAGWEHAAYTQVQRPKAMGRSVRTERWRYVEWDGGKLGTQLYDHESDPREEKNLANDPAHAAKIAELKKLLKLSEPRN